MWVAVVVFVGYDGYRDFLCALIHVQLISGVFECFTQRVWEIYGLYGKTKNFKNAAFCKV